MDNIIPQDTPQKQCYDCKQFKPFTSFKKDKHRPNGIKGICKECHNAKGRDAYTPKVRPTLPEGMKRCSVCKELKPATLEYFSTNKTQSSGFYSSCKPCKKEQDIRVRHINEGKMKQEKWCPSCEETKLIEEFSLSKTRYDGRQAICKACAHLQNIQRRQYRVMYKTTHKAKFLAYEHNRRAAQQSIPGTHTAAQIREQYDRQKGKCWYCRKKVKWGEHHVDHTFPLSRVAGMGIPANSIEYLVITCEHCNLSKKDRFPWEFPQGGRLF